MNKKVKLTAIILSFVAVISVGWTIFDSTVVDGTIANEYVAAAVIKQGATGSTVKTIQQKLKRWGYYTGSVDGIYGSKTVAAVKYFQRKNGLTVDGIVGNKTAAAMGVTLSSSQTGSSGGSSISNNDFTVFNFCVPSPFTW